MAVEQLSALGGEQRTKWCGTRGREKNANGLGEGQRQRGYLLALDSSPVTGSILISILAALLESMNYPCDLVINALFGLNQFWSDSDECKLSQSPPAPLFSFFLLFPLLCSALLSAILVFS